VEEQTKLLHELTNGVKQSKNQINTLRNNLEDISRNQVIEVHKEIPTHGSLEASLNVVDILDKKSGAVIVTNGKCLKIVLN
jgi:predicted transcriptional regulator